LGKLVYVYIFFGFGLSEIGLYFYVFGAWAFFSKLVYVIMFLG